MTVKQLQDLLALVGDDRTEVFFLVIDDAEGNIHCPVRRVVLESTQTLKEGKPPRAEAPLARLVIS